MGIRTFLFGLQRKDVEGKAILEIAGLYAKQQEHALMVVAGAASAFMIGIGAYAVITKSDVDKWIPYAALFLSMLVIIGIRLTMVMPMLQMKQIEDQRQDTAKLVEAVQDLTKELRRRPEVSSTVNFSLFGRKHE